MKRIISLILAAISLACAVPAFAGGTTAPSPLPPAKPLLCSAGTVCDTAIANAMSAGGCWFFPPNATPYYITVPVVMPNNGCLEFPAGSTVQATSAWSGDGMFDAGLTDGSTKSGNVVLIGQGTIDANGYAPVGVYWKGCHNCTLNGLRINNWTQEGIFVGPTGGPLSDQNYIENFIIGAPEVSGGGNLGTIGLDIGPTASDSLAFAGVIIGARIGVQNNGAFINMIELHPWTSNNYGPMYYAFDFESGGPGQQYCIDCYADTPTPLATGQSPVYGFYINAYNVTLINPRGYLPTSASGAVDNVADFIYINKSGSNLTVFGGATKSQSGNALTWSAIVTGPSASYYNSGVDMIGLTTDGYAHAFRNGDKVSSSFATPHITTVATTVSGLSGFSFVGAGDRAFVTDSTQTLAAGIGTAVVGSGSNTVPVYYDGTTWRIG